MRYRPELDLVLKDISMTIVSICVFLILYDAFNYFLSHLGKKLAYVEELGLENLRYDFVVFITSADY